LPKTVIEAIRRHAIELGCVVPHFLGIEYHAETANGSVKARSQSGFNAARGADRGAGGGVMQQTALDNNVGRFQNQFRSKEHRNDGCKAARNYCEYHAPA
jgi:hypothetical protein